MVGKSENGRQFSKGDDSSAIDKKSRKKTIVIVLLVLLLAASLAGLGYLVWQQVQPKADVGATVTNYRAKAAKKSRPSSIVKPRKAA